MSLSEQDREALADAVCRRDARGNFVPKHLNAVVEQIVARHVEAFREQAVAAIRDLPEHDGDGWPVRAYEIKAYACDLLRDLAPQPPP